MKDFNYRILIIGFGLLLGWYEGITQTPIWVPLFSIIFAFIFVNLFFSKI